ncbi:MAG: metallophosphatase family protein [Bacteroidales bacterium]|nr:metallophosphatase family protein [Bacteroidales bacterium]
MKKIGLLSDTHGNFDERLKNFFKDCDEIWHAGDIGNIETADKIAAFKPLKAVYGNIDGHDLRAIYPLTLRFFCEEVEVLMTHIGGYPGRYDRSVYHEITSHPPKIFISGHSHILKIMPDKKLKLLHINPGAAGISGLHIVRTAVRFMVDGKDIRDVEVWELERK